MPWKNRHGLHLHPNHVHVLPNVVDEFDVRMVPEGKRGIDAYKGDTHFEITPLDVISNDTKASLGPQKIEFKRADAKVSHEPRTLFEKEI